MLLLISFLLPVALTLIATPIMIRFAHRYDILDHPDKRKVHGNPIPRIGGVAIAICFALTLATVWFLFPSTFSTIINETNQTLYFGPGIVAILMILILGSWDDIHQLNPGIKFFIQFLAAALAYTAGFKITILSDPFSTGLINLEWLSFPLTVLWIVGITNAFNLIDGLDGLASGTAIIALTTMGLISFYYGRLNIVLISLVLSGAAAGFLWYNFRPARIFLGDSGSLFLGFVLSLLSIESFTKVSTSFALFLPLFALGLPILDTTLSMSRRFLAWFLPDNMAKSNSVTFRQIVHSIFQPDKSHVHHQLIQRGLSHKHTVLVMYVVSALFGACAIAIALTTDVEITVFVLMVITFVTIAGISKLKYREIAFLHNGIFLSLYNRLLINRNELQKGLDLVFIILAFLVAYTFTPSGEETLASGISADVPFLAITAIVVLIQLVVFWLSGLYRETIQQIGIADVFQILKSIILAVTVSALVLSLIPLWQIDQIFTLSVFNFYFLATLLLGIRFFFHLLKHLFLCSNKGPHKVLIYGAGDQGMLTLQRLLTMYSGTYGPIGFLDEDPALEGKYINGFPVFGGHWKIERLMHTHDIEYLFVAIDDLKPEVQRRIQSIARQYDLSVKQLQVQINEIPEVAPSTSRIQKKSMPYAT